MAGEELAVGLGTYAALEASAAKEKAEKAEMRAFVNGYTHTSATPEERQRYVSIVQQMYPQQAAPQEIDPVSARIVGGLIVGTFLATAIGAFVEHRRGGEAVNGAAMGFCIVLLGGVAVMILAVVAVGVRLLVWGVA